MVPVAAGWAEAGTNETKQAAQKNSARSDNVRDFMFVLFWFDWRRAADGRPVLAVYLRSQMLQAMPLRLRLPVRWFRPTIGKLILRRGSQISFAGKFLDSCLR